MTSDHPAHLCRDCFRPACFGFNVSLRKPKKDEYWLCHACKAGTADSQAELADLIRETAEER